MLSPYEERYFALAKAAKPILDYWEERWAVGDDPGFHYIRECEALEDHCLGATEDLARLLKSFGEVLA